MINCLSFSPFPFILSSNYPSLYELFLNSISTNNNLIFELPFPFIPFCILLRMSMPSVFNDFIFLGVLSSYTSRFYFLRPLSSLSILLLPPLPLPHAVFSLCFPSPTLSSTGPEYILDASSTVCYATYGMFLN